MERLARGTAGFSRIAKPLRNGTLRPVGQLLGASLKDGPHVTTGPQVIAGSAGFLLFCATGIAFTKYIGNPMERSIVGTEAAKRTARIRFWIWAVLVGIAVVVFVAGFVAWLTGTTRVAL